MVAMNEPVLYTLPQVAQLLGVHYETVARWVRTGKLRGVKLSRRKVVVPQEQLEAFLAGGTSTAGSAQRWMALARTLTPQEAEQLRASAQDFEHVEVEG
jgi:excisionase family DNA binding protein